MKVVSFNIRCCDDPEGHSVAERSVRLLRILQDEEPDLIGMQEYRDIWGPYISEKMAKSYDCLNICRTTTGWKESAPLYWKKDRFACEEKRWFWFSDTPEVESGGWDTTGHKRLCSYVTLSEKESGKRFRFFNTHFGFGDHCQRSSVALIRKKCDELPKLPTILTGDFNFTPDTPYYAAMTDFLRDSCDKELRKSPTYHGYKPDSDAAVHIDYCFYGTGLACRDYRILRRTFDGYFPSDHYGICAELSFTD